MKSAMCDFKYGVDGVDDILNKLEKSKQGQKPPKKLLSGYFNNSFSSGGTISFLEAVKSLG